MPQFWIRKKEIEAKLENGLKPLKNGLIADSSPKVDLKLFDEINEKIRKIEKENFGLKGKAF